MPVSVARHAGFCMGVKRAVDGAVKAAQEGKPIVSFGELAHNPEVIRRLNAMGISVIHEVEQWCLSVAMAWLRKSPKPFVAWRTR